MGDTVTIDFSGHVRVRIGGYLDIPRKLWESKSGDEAWSLELEAYVKEQYDPPTHDQGFEDDEIEIDDICLAKVD